MTTRLLPDFENRCRAWYMAGYGRRPCEARLWLYGRLANLYGMPALVRHVSLLRDALDNAEERARNGGNKERIEIMTEIKKEISDDEAYRVIGTTIKGGDKSGSDKPGDSRGSSGSKDKSGDDKSKK